MILTPQGLEKLQEAKSEMEWQGNSGDRYTLEDMSDRTGLSVDTLMKVLKCEAGVDQQTLKCCFSAFNLVLEPSIIADQSLRLRRSPSQMLRNLLKT